MTGQRARSAVVADHRSAHPDIPGAPWWGAVLIALAGTALGFAVDAMNSGDKLTPLFAGCYAAGCVIAVLAVRYSSIFTAVVQPPLILFVSIPLAYLIMSKAPLSGGKSTALTIGYPLVERFPLMISTALGVLIIGVVRWYWGMSRGKSAEKAKPDRAKTAKPKATREPKAARDTKPRTPARTRVQTLVDAEAKPARPRRPARADGSAPAPARQGRPGSSPRRRPTHDSEPINRRVSLGTPWDDEHAGRTERRAPRRPRDEYRDEYPDRGYDHEEQPRRRPPLREPIREPRTHHPISRVRYRGDDPLAGRPSRHDDPLAGRPARHDDPLAGRPSRHDDPLAGRPSRHDEPPARGRRDDSYDSWEYDR